MCRDFDIITAFKSGKTLRSHLTKVIHSVQYTLHCGKVYIGKTTTRLEETVKEHQDACKRSDEKVSGITEHAW